jgi:hypothetical protein
MPLNLRSKGRGKREMTEVPDLKNEATEPTKRTEKTSLRKT